MMFPNLPARTASGLMIAKVMVDESPHRHLAFRKVIIEQARIYPPCTGIIPSSSKLARLLRSLPGNDLHA